MLIISQPGRSARCRVPAFALVSLFVVLSAFVLGLPPETAVKSWSMVEAAPPSAPRAGEVPTHPRRLGDLVEGATTYDGKQVTVYGEVIGDVMIRGSYGWINITDGSTTIGVWGDESLLREVKHVGGYKSLGDRVKVTGVFRRADSSQGGELDIQAFSITVTSRGRRIEHPITRSHVMGAFISVAIAIVLGVLSLQVLRNQIGVFGRRGNRR